MIYFMENSSGNIKIGYSCNPAKRLSSVARESRCAITLLAMMRGNKEDEAALHARFSSYRLKGEWFRTSPKLKSLISSIEPTACDDELIVQTVIFVAGGQTILAKTLKTTRQAINQWKRIPDLRVLAIEKLTGISRHVLRPDIYGAR